MTLKEFRSNPSLVEYAASLMADPRFQQLLAVLDGEHPKNYRTLARGLPETDHTLMLGRVFGYDEYRNNLAAAAVLEGPQAVPLMATFEPLETVPVGEK